MTMREGAGYLGRTVGELVAENYARAAVLSRAQIDFCCGGMRTLSEACQEAGASTDAVVEALVASDHGADESPQPDLRIWPVDEMVSHIEEVHHSYVRRTLPVLLEWTAKIARVHGETHPELIEVRTLFGELADELVRHMEDEEDVVFPRLIALAGSANAGDDSSTPPGALVEALEDDHEQAGALMKGIRHLTDGFLPPPDACATYAATLALLAEFETDLHRHVHLENNVLFPRARTTYAARHTTTHDLTEEPLA